MDSRLLPLGEHALLVELGGTDEVLTATAALGRLAAAGHGVWRGVEDLLEVVQQQEQCLLAQVVLQGLAVGLP